jgi:hypothetical protein
MTTLTLYLVKKGEKWVRITSDDLVVGTQLTRLLQMSQDSRPIENQKVNPGDRLTYHRKKDATTYEVIASDWVVVSVSKYNPEEEGEEFGGVAIAFCERQPIEPIPLQQIKK